MHKIIIAAIAFVLCSTSINAQEQTNDSITPQQQANPANNNKPAAATAVGTATVALSQKFGFLSYTKALQAMPEYAKAQKSLNELRTTYEKELQRSEEAFNKQFEEYIDGQKSFPENILLKRQKELQQLMEQSLAFKQEAQRLIIKAEKEMMEPIHARLNDILANIGQKNGFAYILNTDSNSYPFINPSQGVDITNEVLNKIK